MKMSKKPDYISSKGLKGWSRYATKIFLSKICRNMEISSTMICLNHTKKISCASRQNSSRSFKPKLLRRDSKRDFQILEIEWLSTKFVNWMEKLKNRFWLLSWTTSRWCLSHFKRIFKGTHYIDNYLIYQRWVKTK